MMFLATVMFAICAAGAGMDFVTTLRYEGDYSSPGHRLFGLALTLFSAVFCAGMAAWGAVTVLNGSSW